MTGESSKEWRPKNRHTKREKKRAGNRRKREREREKQNKIGR